MKNIIWFYPVLIFILLIYSYTQVDLNLTLFRAPFWLSFQKWAQNIGYFQRPLSTLLFFVISSLLFVFYFYFLKISNKLSNKQIWFLIGSTALILAFSYNAFSYDFFNYIFDAKIITFYHQNPYLHRALDFPKDPMLLFMHWTHRVYPYGPSWLALTVPLSFLGKGLFIPTFFMLKVLMTGFYLGTVYFIQKILKEFNSSNEKFGAIFFALNPLVIYESLISSHNDIAMMFFAILAFYFLVNKKRLASVVYLTFSIGVKFATALLLPVYLYVFLRRKKSFQWERVIQGSIALMLIGVIAATFRTNFQPWYLIPVLPFAAMLPNKPYVFLPTAVITFLSLMQYLPYLYLGNWDPPVPMILGVMLSLSIALAVILTGVYYLFRKRS